MMLRRFSRQILEGLTVAIVMSLPLVVGTSLSAFIFTPWMVQVSSKGWAFVFGVGGTIGGTRALIVLGPMLGIHERPVMALAVSAAYSFVMHAVWAVALRALLKLDSVVVQAVGAGFLVFLLDVSLCRGELPLCQLTTAYALAGSDLFLKLFHLVDACWLAFPAGIISFLCFYSFSRFGRRWLVGAIVVFVPIVSVVDCLHIRGETDAGVTLRVLAIPNPVRSAAWEVAAAKTPDLIVLPEYAVAASPLEPSGSNEISLRSLKQLSLGVQGALVLSGYSEKADAGYRNAVLFLDEDRMRIKDKRRAIPGVEAPVFSGWPVLGALAQRVFPIEVAIQTDTREGKLFETGKHQFAACVCFDHSCTIPHRSWGVARADKPELLICVGKLDGLGRLASWEQPLSRRARRVHAATFRCPLLYVTDLGSEVVYPDGRVYSHFGSCPRLWAISTVGF